NALRRTRHRCTTSCLTAHASGDWDLPVRVCGKSRCAPHTPAGRVGDLPLRETPRLGRVTLRSAARPRPSTMRRPTTVRSDTAPLVGPMEPGVEHPERRVPEHGFHGQPVVQRQTESLCIEQGDAMVVQGSANLPAFLLPPWRVRVLDAGELGQAIRTGWYWP